MVLNEKLFFAVPTIITLHLRVLMKSTQHEFLLIILLLNQITIKANFIPIFLESRPHSNVHKIEYAIFYLHFHNN